MDRANRVRFSKTLAHALQHAPSIYELELDHEGWVPLGGMLAALIEDETSHGWQAAGERASIRSDESNCTGIWLWEITLSEVHSGVSCL